MSEKPRLLESIQVGKKKGKMPRGGLQVKLFLYVLSKAYHKVFREYRTIDFFEKHRNQRLLQTYTLSCQSKNSHTETYLSFYHCQGIQP